MLPSLWGQRWIRNWAHTSRGQRTLEELCDLGYQLDPPLISGGARNFDATDDNIDRASDDATLDVDFSDSLIVQALFKLDAVSTVNRIIAGKKNGQFATGNTGWQLGMTTLEKIQFHVSDGVDVLNAVDGTPITAGTWYAYTAIHRAVAGNNEDALLYAEDVLVGGPNNSTLLGNFLNARPFRVGSDSAATPAIFWDGDIAYVRVWIKSAANWTTAEESAVIQARNRLLLPAGWGPATMRLQWVLWDAGTPATTRDWSGNGLTGTYTGTTFANDPGRVLGPGGSSVWKLGRLTVSAAVPQRTLVGVGI